MFQQHGRRQKRGMTHWEQLLHKTMGKTKNPFFGLLSIRLFAWGMAWAGKLSTTFHAICCETVRAQQLKYYSSQGYTTKPRRKYMIHPVRELPCAGTLRFHKPANVPPTPVPSLPKSRWFCKYSHPSQKTQLQNNIETAVFIIMSNALFTLKPK